MTYDSTNVFAKILKGQIPCQKVYESEDVLAFYDLYPKTPIHVLVIPKGPYCDFTHFCQSAPKSEVAEFFSHVAAIVKELGLPEKGYRLIVNAGAHGGQEVPHFHVHILAGKPIGPMVNTSAE